MISAFYPGFFVGSATAELMAVYMFLRNCPHYPIILYTDSQVVMRYLRGFEPSSDEGRKLRPLILLCRNAAIGFDVCFQWKARAHNRAHLAARRGMLTGRAGNWLRASENVDPQLAQALKAVEAGTRHSHHV